MQMYNSYINICGGTFKGQTVFNNDSSTLVIDGENVRVENYEKNTGRYSVAIKSSGTTTIKNGTFVCVRNGVIAAFSDSVTNIEGGSFSGRLGIYGGEFTISAGTFPQGIDLWDSEVYDLESLLADGYAFFDSDGNVVALNGLTQYDEALTVKRTLTRAALRPVKGICVKAADSGTVKRMIAIPAALRPVKGICVKAADSGTVKRTKITIAGITALVISAEQIILQALIVHTIGTIGENAELAAKSVHIRILKTVIVRPATIPHPSLLEHIKPLLITILLRMLSVMQ